MAVSLSTLREEARQDLHRWGKGRRARERRKLASEYGRLAYTVLRLEECGYWEPPDDDDWEFVRDVLAFWPERCLRDQVVVKRFLDALEVHVTQVECGAEMLERLLPDSEDAKGSYGDEDEDEAEGD